MSTVLTVRTPTLEIGYHAAGDTAGFPIILLHGFPDDAHAYDTMTPPLAEAGYRVLAPYLRGYGPTRFLDPAQPRKAQQAAIAQDLIDFMDGLGIERAALCGYDWGGRAACLTAILAPERVRALVTIGGYNVQNALASPRPVEAVQERSHWYQWYFNTARGEAGLEQHRHDICRLLWQEWSPTWKFDDATYNLTAPAFDNPDFVPIVIHSYRHRHSNDPGDPRFDAVERRFAESPPITVPTIVLHGADDTVSRPQRSEGHMSWFAQGTARHVVPGAGHFMPREKPDAVVEALLTLLSATA